MAEITQHTWNFKTEVPAVLTRATVADGKYIQKDTIDPLINRDEALKRWLEDTGDELVRVSGELMDTISSVSSTLDTKIDTTSAALHNEITAASASLHEELTAASADLYSQTTAVSSNLYTSLTSTSSTLNTKIDTASGNIMSDMKTSADNLILYTNSASAYVQGNLQTSADTLVSALNDLDTEFNEYLSALSANVSSNYVQKGGSQSVGQIAVWESVANGLKVSGRNIETQAANIAVDGGSSTFIPTVGAVAGAIDNKVAGLFKFKGSETVAKINNLSNPNEGDVYNVADNGTITNGEGGTTMPVSAGDNIVWVKPTDSNGYWDKMAAAFDDSNCMKKVSPVTTNNIATFGTDGQVNDSGKSVTAAAPASTSTDNTLPTSLAVYKAISGFASKVAAGDAGEILVASTGGDLSGSNVTITTTKPGTGSTDATVPTSLAVSGAIYDATTGKLDKFSNYVTAGNVVVVNPDGTTLSASNYTLGASIPTPTEANKVLKTDNSKVPTWVDEDIVPIKYTQYPTGSAKVESITFTRNSYGGNDLYVYLENQSGDSKHYALFPYDSEAGIVKYNGRGKYSVAELPVYNYGLQDHTVTGVKYMDGMAGNSVLTLNTDDGLTGKYTMIKTSLPAGFIWNQGAGLLYSKAPTGDGLFGVKQNGDFEAVPSYSEGYGIIIRDNGTVMTKARVPETGNVVCPPYSVGNDWTIIGDLGNNKLMCKYQDASRIIIGLRYLGSGTSPRFTFIGKKITGKASAVCSVTDVSSINQLISYSGGQMFLLSGEDMDTEARVNIDGIVFGHTSLHIVKYKDENGNIRIGYTAFQHFENT